jgi:uncharacterized membrane protein
MQKLIDNILWIYVLILSWIACVFVGHEIHAMKVGSELRNASRAIEACNKIIIGKMK